MSAIRTIHSDLRRVFLLTLISLFAIPAATLLFTRYAMHTEDVDFLQSIQARITASTKLTAEQKTGLNDFYQNHLLSQACDATGPDDQKFHDDVCSPYSMEWQFHWMDRAALWTLLFGVALLVVALLLAALAFANRGLRYASFVAGWRLMTISSAIEVLLQGAMCVWLSFWLTAYFMEVYVVKLIAMVGILAAMAVFFAIWTMFKKFPSNSEIEGELLPEADAPRLWDRVRQLAGRVGTAPPDNIVAGIDSNFFVTEAPTSVAGKPLKGRTLFVSIPLLRVMDQTEADAVLAHELAHLGGGDTRSSALLGPKLRLFDIYTAKMRHNGLTIVAHYLLRLYRMIFEFAMARASREREFSADRVAAGLTEPGAIVRSLIKIAAYSSYRGDVERKLFAYNQQHEGALGIAGFVAEGLQPYATSTQFLEAMKTADVPHPYDTHPALVERMRNVEHHVPEDAYGNIVTAVPAQTWADEILTAGDIEQRLWGEYERRFAESHEESLAYRYEPANDEEKAVVLRHFPDTTFTVRNNDTVEVTYAGLRASAGEGVTISWDQVKALTAKDGTLGKALIVTLHEKGVLRSKTVTIKLRGIGKREKEFKGAVSHYWRRHQIMRAQQADRATDPSAA